MKIDQLIEKLSRMRKMYGNKEIYLAEPNYGLVIGIRDVQRKDIRYCGEVDSGVAITDEDTEILGHILVITGDDNVSYDRSDDIDCIGELA